MSLQVPPRSASKSPSQFMTHHLTPPRRSGSPAGGLEHLGKDAALWRLLLACLGCVLAALLHLAFCLDEMARVGEVGFGTQTTGRDGQGGEGGG